MRNLTWGLETWYPSRTAPGAGGTTGPFTGIPAHTHRGGAQMLLLSRCNLPRKTTELETAVLHRLCTRIYHVSGSATHQEQAEDKGRAPASKKDWVGPLFTGAEWVFVSLRQISSRVSKALVCTRYSITTSNMIQFSSNDVPPPANLWKV